MGSTNTVEVKRGIYWVGANGQDGGLHCNPYLLIDGEDVVLFDPGSVLDFEYVYENVLGIVPLEKINYVVLHHQDPDFCSSVPLFEQKGGSFKVVTHWRTQTLVKYYGIKSEYYIVNENNFRLVLSSGRELKFIQTPYLHFPGAIATYDTASKMLFSSDLFGAFSYEWNLYAQDDYIEKMKVFHEHYMPSNEILRPVMEVFLGMDISVIAPQHGSIITDDVKKYIRALRDLECGAFMLPIKKELAKSGGYISVCSSIIKRFAAIFPKGDVLEVLRDLEISIEKDTFEISDYNYTGDVLWNKIFEQAYTRKGIQWLLVIEPLAYKISKEFDIPMPDVFVNTIKKAEGELYKLSEENEKLKEINDHLNNSIRETQEKLTRCPVTGLYNYEFFKNYLTAEINDLFGESTQNPSIIIISVDNMAKIKFSYGDAEVEETLKNIVYIINDLISENTMVFRLQGAAFACYIPHTTKEGAMIFAEKLRNTVSTSEKFIEQITLSIGVVCMNELSEKNTCINQPSEALFEIAMMRVRLAKNKGMNIVCSISSVEDYQEQIGKIMIVESDEINIDIIRTFLENIKYEVITAKDGDVAFEFANKENIDLIISEIMIPKTDGFLLREKLAMQSHTKNIPFIIVSNLKDDNSVNRAMSLGIEHYLKKPYMLSELLGIIKNKIKGEAYQ